MKLYRVITIVAEYGDCKDIPFKWFRLDYGEPRPYAELIENYDPSDELVSYAEGAIDELFTLSEATELKEYLDRQHGGADVTTIKEVILPLPNTIIGVGAIPIGRTNDNYMLDAEPAGGATEPAKFEYRSSAPSPASRAAVLTWR
jgi:hypothetical protein